MGVAYYIVLEKDLPVRGDIYVDGKALAEEEEKLKEITHSQGVKDLMSFFSASPEEVGDFFDEYSDIEIPEMEIPETEWFSPGEGLATVRAILDYMEMDRDSFIHRERLLDDLKNFEAILLKAQTYNIKWHLAIDV
ncbi:MAG: hypothetical protein ABRQ37_23425 [Candidatus Eremiobacterota bacterium]